MKPQPQTPPTSTEYVEPLGFKGTKGKWDISGTSKTMQNYYVSSPYTHLLQVFTSLPNPEPEANAKLISQSKELAKALQDIVNDWIGEGSFRSEPEYKTHNDKTVKDFGYWSPAGKQVKAELIAKAQSILKQAGLTE